MNSHAIVYVPTRVGEGFFADFQAPASGNTDNGKVWSWDSLAGKFIPNISVSAFGLTLIDDADAATARGTLGLGTAATLNVGTSANNIIQLDGSARLPAVSGALLTNLPSPSAAGSTTQVQYNSGGVFAGHSGLTYDGAGALAVSGRVVAPVWRPASDGTAALKIKTAADGDFVTFDTVSKRVGVNVAPTASWGLYVRTNDNSASGSGVLIENISTGDIADARLQCKNSAGATAGFFLGGGSRASLANQCIVYASQSIRFLSNNTVDTGGTGDIDFVAGGYAATPQITIKAVGGYVGINIVSPTAILDLAASNTDRASLRIRAGTAPTSPNDGDFWTTTTGAFLCISGVTYSVNLTAI